MARFAPRHFRIQGIHAERLNLRIDENGNQDLSEGRYLVAVVLRDRSANIEGAIACYEARLSSKA